MLEIRNLTKKFGGLTAVHDVSVTFESGHINAIIGPNGAGKTTFFNLIAGTHAPTTGQILFKGQDVAGLRADQIARLFGDRMCLSACDIDDDNMLTVCSIGIRLGIHQRVSIWGRPDGRIGGDGNRWQARSQGIHAIASVHPDSIERESTGWRMADLVLAQFCAEQAEQYLIRRWQFSMPLHAPSLKPL